MVSTIPSDHGISRMSTSAATPMVASTQTMMVASMPCTGSGVRTPGCSLLQTIHVRAITQHQPHEPTISRAAPM